MTTELSAGSISLKFAIVVATLGRPNIVVETLSRIIHGQHFKSFSIIVSCVQPEDAGAAVDLPNVKILTGPPGLAAQRNTALDAIPNDVDVIVFFDDDFVPDVDWLAVAAEFFSAYSDIVSFTGDVLVDDIKGPGLSFEEVDRIFHGSKPDQVPYTIEPYSPYGCNMAFRRSAIGELRFDERLVLYGWLEDRDFGSALAKKGGRFVKSTSARGIHMGVKSGRIAGDRLGYSQIINPLYLMRKGTMSKIQVLDHIFRNFSSNLIRSLLPESYIDRAGRLRGNLRGLMDVFLGRLEPERALLVRSARVKHAKR